MKRLIEDGANINAKGGDFDESPLMIAVRNNSTETVKNFLKNFEKLLQNYFGVKMNLTKIIENKNSNFAQLSDGLGVVHAKVKEVSDTFAQKIEAEEEKVL